jgi:glycosyltransferase involved in cell wall biosynthesis
MTVDLLMPVHGSGRFLLQSIESFNHFSVPESILVVVLDRPDEQLLGVIRGANLSSNCRVLISPGSGIVDALNFGINQSSAKYIGRLDSDDLLMAGRLRRQIEILELNPGIVCVGTQIELIDDHGNYLGYTRYPTNSRKISQRLQYQNCIAHPSVMFRRTFGTTTFHYRRAFTGAEDYDLWLRMAKIGKVINLDEKLTKYRVSQGQYSSTFGKSIREIENLSRAVNLFPTPKLDLTRQLKGNQCTKLFYSILMANLIKSPKKCTELISSNCIGLIIGKSMGTRKLLLKLLSAIPYAMLAFFFSPQIFTNFCIGLFSNRTIKAAK